MAAGADLVQSCLTRRTMIVPLGRMDPRPFAALSFAGFHPESASVGAPVGILGLVLVLGLIVPGCGSPS